MQKLLPLFGIILLLWGCTTLGEQLQERRPTPVTPIFELSELSFHLRTLNAPDMMGRATATEGFTRAAEYVAELLHEALWQPVAEPAYFYPYAINVHFPLRARMTLHLPDSLVALRPGVDFLIDGRSASGTERFSEILLQPVPGRPLNPPVVLISAERASPSLFHHLCREGARVVLEVGPLQPSLYTAPPCSLVVLQVNPAVAARMLGITRNLLQLHLTTVRHQRLPLAGLVELSAEVRSERLAPAIHVGAYLGSKHPTYGQELVIVATDLDGGGDYPGWGSFHPPYPGTGAAALLEVVRNLGAYSPYLRLPERTVLVLFLSGSRQDNQGLRAFLEAPTWPPDRIHGFIYVDPDSTARRMLERLSPSLPFPIALIEKGSRPPASAVQNPDSVLTAEALRAQQLARATHNELLLQAITPWPATPEDTLKAPTENPR